MNEQTNPQAGVSQGDPHSVERAVSRLVQSQDQAPEDEREQEASPESPETAEQAQGQAEPTVEDLEVEVEATDEQPAVDAFEIVHNGQQVKLTREDTIKYAQQGFDATRKLQAAADQSRQAASQLQRLSQLDQVHPLLLQERAQVEALGSQIRQYENFNWIKLANEDPMAYPAARAQYDVLVQAYQHANARYQQHEGGFQQHLAQVAAERRHVENARIPELIPEWKDKAKRDAGEASLAKHYADTYGISFEELNGALTGAIPVAIAYKAMKYDQLVKGKTAKQLRTAPPVTVPGAKTGSVKTDQEKQLRAKLRKTGSIDDAAALLLNRMT